MRDYELTVIISPQVADENVQATMDKIGRWITEKGGNIVQVEPWGRRRLSYPIRHFAEGNYVLTRFQAEPKGTETIEASLRISEEILRYLLVKVEV